MSATPPSIAIAAPVIGGPEVVRVVLESSSTATPPSIAIAAPVLGGPEVVRVVLESCSRVGFARCVGKQQLVENFVEPSSAHEPTRVLVCLGAWEIDLWTRFS